MSRTRKGAKRETAVGPLPKWLIPLQVKRPFRRETKRLCRILKSVKNHDNCDLRFPKYQPSSPWFWWA